MEITRAKKHILVASLLCITAVVGIVFWVSKDNLSNAADARRFNASNIMSDVVMTNKSSMSESQIQAFLLSKNSCNDTNTGKASQYPQFQYNIKNGKFVCLAEETFNGESAARIIWQAGQDYNINPQVLIVLLQKEQGLITDTWPNSTQYRSATGYGCPDTAACAEKYYGFKNQVRNAANFFRAYQTGNTGWYKLVWPGNNYTGSWQPFDYNLQYHPNTSCGTVSTRIENRATASLYSYTPYRPNQPALNAQYGRGDGCSSYGNRNFWLYFSDWFGNTTGTLYNGLDFAMVFNADYYLNKYADLKLAFGDDKIAAFDHFITNGIKEGRQATEGFDVLTYRAQNPDLRLAFGKNLIAYFEHYAVFGHKENRVTTGSQKTIYVSSADGKNYSTVYDFESYINKYEDLRRLYSNDEIGALSHFVVFGMREGRVANDTFNVTSYKDRYPDLRRAFGGDLKSYYLHFISHGKNEGRVATGDTYNGVTTLSGVDYSSIYNFTTYINGQADVKRVYGVNDERALEHFVVFGMREGRVANDTFNVTSYKDRYPDLRRAFGGDLKSYYLHFISHGKNEGRVAI